MKFFSKNQKNPILRAILSPFFQKMQERALSVFKHYNYLPSCKNSHMNIILYNLTDIKIKIMKEIVRKTEKGANSHK